MVKYFFALALISTGGFVCGQEQSATSISREVKEVFERSAKAVVKIQCRRSTRETFRHGLLH